MGKSASHYAIKEDLGKIILAWQQENNLQCVANHAVAKNTYLRKYLVAQGVTGFIDITAPSIQAFKLSCGFKKNTGRTIRAKLAAISNFCEYAIDQGCMSCNPCQHIKRPRLQEGVVVYYYEQEVRLILKAGQEQNIYLPVFMALKTGLRAGELRRLQWEQIDLHRRVITVINTKSKKIRYVPIAADMLAVLVSRVGTGPVFPNRSGQCWGRSTWDNWIKKLAAALPLIFIKPRPNGGPGNGWHGFRSTWITNCVNAGIPVHKVAKWAGHSNIAVTQRYLFAASGYDDDIEKL